MGIADSIHNLKGSMGSQLAAAAAIHWKAKIISPIGSSRGRRMNLAKF
jgi:hypothetical protein